MIAPNELLFLLFLVLGVLLAFYAGFLVFKDPWLIKRSRRPMAFALVATALIAASAVLFELRHFPQPASFACSFATPFPPTTLTCIATTTDAKSEWKVVSGGQLMSVPPGSSMTLQVNSPGDYTVILTSASRGFLGSQTRETKRTFRLAGRPTPQLQVRSFGFVFKVTPNSNSEQTFVVAPTERIHDAHIEIGSATNATVSIVSMQDNKITIAARPQGDIKLFPFGVQRESGYVAGQVVVTVETTAR